MERMETWILGLVGDPGAVPENWNFEKDQGDMEKINYQISDSTPMDVGTAFSLTTVPYEQLGISQVEVEVHPVDEMSNIQQKVSNAAATYTWLMDQRLTLSKEVENFKLEQSENRSLGNIISWFQSLEYHTCTSIQDLDNCFRSIDNLSNDDHSRKISRDNLKNQCYDLRLNFDSYNYSLAKEGLIVSKNPREVIRRSTKADAKTQKDSKIAFEMELLICAGHRSGYFQENLEVDAILISEKQASKIQEGTLNPMDTNFRGVGEMTNSTAIVERYSGDQSCLVARFTNVRIQPHATSENAASTGPYEILFRIKTSVDNDNGKSGGFSFWVTSSPFAVVTNGSKQDIGKEALMFWKNLISTTAPNVTDMKSISVPFPRFFGSLNRWFKKTVAAGSIISINRDLGYHEGYIHSKLYECARNQAGEDVTWKMMTKDKSPLTGRKFWNWIYSIAQYVQKFPHDWENGLLQGFISRDNALRMVHSINTPSIVFRFSESWPGKITATYADWVLDRSTGKFERTVGEILIDEENDCKLTLGQFVEKTANLRRCDRILPINVPVTALYKGDVGRNPGKTERPYLTKLNIFVKE